MSFLSECREIADKAGGSKKTISNRKGSLRLLSRFLQKCNIQIRHLRHLRLKHLIAWIHANRAAGVTARTCQNMLSDVRVCLREHKRGLKADSIMTGIFGIDGASRAGTRTAISEDDYLDRLARVRDPGVKHILILSWHLGLRRREGIFACEDTLIRWARELKSGDRIGVIAGTKGGRPRQTKVIDRVTALAAVERAMQVAQTRGGRLIDTPNLKHAIHRFQRQVALAGFVDKLSPHSLRYAWTQRSMLRYKNEGLSYREALIATSLDLGHGDGRGVWVRWVYNLEGIRW